MLRMVVLNRFVGGFVMFSRGKEKRLLMRSIDNLGYQISSPDNLGYQMFKPKTPLLTDGDDFPTWAGPEKVRSFYSKVSTLITEADQK